MSYIKRKGYGMMGLGDSTPTCRTGDAVFQNGNWWIPIRDSDGKQYPLMQTPELAALPKCAAAAGGTSTPWWQALISGATDVLKTKVQPGQTTIIQGGGGGGMSTTTKVALAGAAALGLVLVLRKRK